MAGQRVFGLLLAGLAIIGIYLYDSPNRQNLINAFNTLKGGKIVESDTGASNKPDFGAGSLAPMQVTIPAPSNTLPPALPLPPVGAF